MSEYRLWLKPWVNSISLPAAEIKARLDAFVDDNEMWRMNIDNDTIIAQVYTANMDPGYDEFDGWKYALYTPDRNAIKMGPFTTCEIAMKECDIRLVELGYVFLTQEQIDKIEVLL